MSQLHTLDSNCATIHGAVNRKHNLAKWLPLQGNLDQICLKQYQNWNSWNIRVKSFTLKISQQE